MPSTCGHGGRSSTGSASLGAEFKLSSRPPHPCHVPPCALSNPIQKQGLHPGLSGHRPSVILRVLYACPWQSTWPPPALTTLSAAINDQTLL